jgi:hypothetical protein
MTINYEIKGNLARLLATEDLVVEHKKVTTAQFNVQSRVLTLPMWDRASGMVYDLLVAHEVGHALYTPNEDWTTKIQIPHSYVNVTEDARVEKLMKRRYGGLNKTFYRGYKELSDDDFFDLGDSDINQMNLADRVNIYFKIGSFVKVNFNEEERKIVDMIESAETFDDALAAANAMYEYSKNKDNEEVDFTPNTSETNQDSGGGVPQDSSDQSEEQIESQGAPSGQEGETDDEQPKSKELKTEETKTEEQSNTGGERAGNLEVKTDNAFSQKVENLTGSSPYQENVYVETPDLTLDSVVIPNSEVHDYISSYWNKLLKSDETANFIKCDSRYASFKKECQKEVNYMVKEFECKKSADAYSRSLTTKTGVLNTAILHTYKFNEDVFKKVTVLPDGKNHGLVFVLDWSGSMSGCILDTVKQLYSLIWFCNKSQIPFEVFLFTNEWEGPKEWKLSGKPARHFDRKPDVLDVNWNFNMVNILTSSVRKSDLETQLLNLWRCAYYFENYNNSHERLHYDIPAKMWLSGTPLNEAIISLHKIIPHFKSKYKVQKTHCIILTDGEAADLTRLTLIRRGYDKSEYIGNNYCGGNTFIRNRKTGNTYSVGYESNSMTNVLLRNISDEMPDVNFIGFRLLQNREFYSYMTRVVGTWDENLKEIWRKEKSLSLTTPAYKKLFVLSTTSLAQDTDFVVSNDASKSQIKTAFKKSLMSKKVNKKILSEFIGLVA